MAPTGILLVAKPRGPTSREVVAAVERRLEIRGLGHCGTLDPLASGLLVLVSGQASRLQDRLTGHDKVYRALVRLGETSATDDDEGPIAVVSPVPAMPTREEVEAALRGFLGVIDQRPPRHSALRQDGERLWQKARRGEDFEPPPRRVRIDRIDLLRHEPPEVLIELACGAGTYVRSLARDLGRTLGTGGRLRELERTRSGPFELARARAPDEIGIDDLLPLEVALAALPRALVAEEDLRDLLDGKEVRHRGPEALQDDSLIWASGRIIGRARRLSPGSFRLKRIVVHPFEDDSERRSRLDRMSPPISGDPER